MEMKKFKLEIILSYSQVGVRFSPDHEINISTRIDSFQEYQTTFKKARETAFTMFPKGRIENPKTDIDCTDAYDERLPEHFKCYFSFTSGEKKLPKDEIIITLWGFDLSEICDEIEKRVAKFM